MSGQRRPLVTRIALSIDTASVGSPYTMAECACHTALACIAMFADQHTELVSP